MGILLAPLPVPACIRSPIPELELPHQAGPRGGETLHTPGRRR